MRNFIIIAMLSVVAFTTSSCKKEVINNVNQVYSAVYTVNPGDWATDDNSYSYSVSLTVPELDNYILSHGGVDVYLSFDRGVTYETIPEVFGGIAYGSIHKYQTVILDLRSVNGNTITGPTKTIFAKIVLADAKPLN